MILGVYILHSKEQPVVVAVYDPRVQRVLSLSSFAFVDFHVFGADGSGFVGIARGMVECSVLCFAWICSLLHLVNRGLYVCHIRTSGHYDVVVAVAVAWSLSVRCHPL